MPYQLEPLLLNLPKRVRQQASVGAFNPQNTPPVRETKRENIIFPQVGKLPSSGISCSWSYSYLLHGFDKF